MKIQAVARGRQERKEHQKRMADMQSAHVRDITEVQERTHLHLASQVQSEERKVGAGNRSQAQLYTAWPGELEYGICLDSEYFCSHSSLQPPFRGMFQFPLYTDAQ